MTKLISAVLFILLLITYFAFPAMAEESIAPYNSNYFDSYGTTMSRQGNGVIKITFSAVGTGVCSQLGVATYSVEKQNDDGEWVNVSGLLNGETGSGVVSYTFSRYFYGVAKETYRIQVTFTSTINGSTEYKTYTSGKITAN